MTAATPSRMRALPWRRLVWLTWRQHRVTLIGLAVLSLVACTGLLVNGLWMHSVWHGPQHAVLTCNEFDCGIEPFFPSSLYGPGVLVLHLIPVLIGMFLGAPLLTREIEHGTGTFAWSQGIGALRWTMTKVALLAGAAALTVLPIGLLFAWWYPIGQYALGGNLNWPFTHYDLFPASIVRWTLLAVVLGALVGALLRRTVAAIAVTGLVHAVLLTGTLAVNDQPEAIPARSQWLFTEGDGLLLVIAVLVVALVWRVRATLDA